MSLEYEIRLPDAPQDGAAVIVLLHGRGSDRFDLLGLQRGLPPGAIVVTPQAPNPAAPWGYGPGWAWYRFLGEDRPDPETFVASQEAVGSFIDDIGSLLPVRPGPIVIGGFSQGGTMALSFALRNPGKVRAAINYSGFLANHPSVVTTTESVRDLSIFWGHGSQDPVIPISLAERGRARLVAAGADLTVRDYPVGHSISVEELADTRAWLERITGAAAPGRDNES
jgi:phospholipase/carboxylesterase